MKVELVAIFQMISVKRKVKMGGLNSGRRWHSNAKSTINSYHCIDIRKWHREGLLKSGIFFITKWLQGNEITGSINVVVAEKSMILKYRVIQSSESRDMNYPVNLEWTPCRLGGRRPWLICPAKNCGRRVAILYGGAVFACRHCYQLAYPSQRENIGDRAMRKADKIRNRMGWEPGILNGEGLKPKGMHWKTFKQLCLHHNNLINVSLREVILRFGINIFNQKIK